MVAMTRPLSASQQQAIRASLPPDRPFTVAEAAEMGVSNNRCRALVAEGFLVRPVPGVYRCAHLDDSLELRLSILRLVVPADCVVTDRTAAWVWVGDRALAPGDHLAVPRVSVFAPPGRRLRNQLVSSGERALVERDVREVDGVRVTTPLRTACDLARLLHRYQALAAVDALARLCPVDVVNVELERFKGFRGIVQARVVVPLADPRSDSQFESVARAQWLFDAGLPVPECQVPVRAPDGAWYHVDMGLPDDRFGAEYFGEEFHGPDRADADAARLRWARQAERWTLVVAREHHVIGRRRDFDRRLRLAWERHRSTRPSYVTR
jgi:hypothetical protein